MPDIPNLGEAAARMRAALAEDAAMTAGLLSGEPVEEMAEAAPQIVQVDTAFIVAWIKGEVIISADLNAPIVADHFPTADEILGAAAILQADRTAERAAGLAGMQAAQQTVDLIEQKQQEAMARMQAARDKALGQQLLQQDRG